MFGKLTAVRDEFFCRRCHKGHGQNDEILNLNRVHRKTKGMTEVITYAAARAGYGSLKKIGQIQCWI